MDTLIIEDLSIPATIGTQEWEQKVQQNLRFDIELATDAARIASTDDLRLAIDYAAVAEQLQSLLAEKSFKLIETVAETAAQLLLEHFPVCLLKIKVTTFQPVNGMAAAKICIERQPNA